MTFLEKYELEKQAEAAQEAETIQLLAKYASVADELLAQEYGTDYTKDDVIELASKLIENDANMAAAQEKTASVDPEVVGLLDKYASVADELLAAEYGNNYTEDDIVELAAKLIQNDANIAAAQEKTANSADLEKQAELYEMGRIIALGLKDELNR